MREVLRLRINFILFSLIVLLVFPLTLFSTKDKIAKAPPSSISSSAYLNIEKKIMIKPKNKSQTLPPLSLGPAIQKTWPSLRE